MKIGVIGLGYVGLPLCLQFSKSGAEVLGFDVDLEKIESLNRGESYIKHISSEEIQAQLESESLEATADIGRVRELDAVLICVPTPLDENHEPNLSYIMNTAQGIAPYLPRGITVVLESTTYPGTTEEELKPILEKGSGMKAGFDFYLAFSPEREDPGNPRSQVSRIPKVIGGCTPACLEKAMTVYSTAIETLIPVSSCKTAEATKLLENIYRSVNIALVNELKLIYGNLGIDIWEAIEAAKTKPFGFTPFYPGPGLGGHCIPIDPFYLTWKAKQHGMATRFIELSGEIHHAMPRHVVNRCKEALAAQRKEMSGSKVVLLGLAYKADVDDCRESPTFIVMKLLHDAGVEVAYHDPHVPKIPRTREYAEWAGRQSVPWDQAALAGYDLGVILTAHRSVQHAQLTEWLPAVVDTRNALAGVENPKAAVWKA